MTIKTIREDFPLIKNRGISYLDNSATTQKPRVVIDALKNFYENFNANAHRGIYKLSEDATAKLNESREIIARFINADPEEIIFTKNATEGLNNIANSIERSLEIDKNHNIVATILEHHSNFVTWQQLAKRAGAEFRIADYDDKKHELKDISNFVDENTLVVAFTGMSNVTGIIPDAKSIIQKIRKKNKNVLIVIDATQLVAHKRINVKELDVDFLVFSAHKIYGPSGVGVVYGKRTILEKINPFQYGGNMINRVELYDSDWAELPDKFEAGTIDTPGIFATGVAINYLEKNFSDLERTEKELTGYMLKELRKIPQVRILGHNSTNKKGNEYRSVVSFITTNVHPHDMATICDQSNVCVRAGHHCAQPFMKRMGITATTRASIGMYNNREDIEELIKAIKKAIKIIG